MYSLTQLSTKENSTDDDLEKLEDKLEEYEQKEGKMHCIIYESISDSTFNEIKGEVTAALIWKKLIAVMTGKGDLILCECIEGMGLKIEDNQYTSMIQKLLPPSYDHIHHTLSAASKFTGKPLMSDILVAALHKEWDEEVASKATAENVAMSAQWQNRGKGSGLRGGNCWCKGGGKAGQGPASKKNKAKGKGKAKESASTAIDESDDEHIIAVVADDNDDSNVALMCTSDYKAEGDAHVARGEEVTAITDCGALKMYSPKRWRFKNYTNIDPKPIKATNGEVLKAKGTFKCYCLRVKMKSPPSQDSETHTMHQK
ncbi:hypothetical protein EV421DRAFT_1733128 [Armillaria borealis]|uniref:Uncharacterized protein n=1 Tax=Armillaria borealis TaxID=47425 RepID=A0AA39JS73_9AGAR|nr:hypothetical protein EV421DRAFT_1733128 [Armillaria borealis]